MNGCGDESDINIAGVESRLTRTTEKNRSHDPLVKTNAQNRVTLRGALSFAATVHSLRLHIYELIIA